MKLPSIGAGESVASARAKIAAALARVGIEEAEADARLLVQHALGVDRAALLRDPARPLSADESARLQEFAARRLRREPVAHIRGWQEFWGLELAVSAATLIPRPETETVVETALALLDESAGRARQLRLVDVGTGSGAILLALLSELPAAFGVGVDRSLEALAVARANASACALSARSAFVCGELAEPLGAGFDLLLSNPPYVVRGDMASLPPEVRYHEPRLALDGGMDGLDAYRALAREAGRVLAPNGFALLEVGAGQAEVVTQVFARHGLRPHGAPRADLAGISRVVVLRAAG